MRYRVYKERRLLKPYKIQTWQGDGGWFDCVKIHRIHDEAVMKTRYFWTAKQAVREIEKDCTRESLYE